MSGSPREAAWRRQFPSPVVARGSSFLQLVHMVDHQFRRPAHAQYNEVCTKLRNDGRKKHPHAIMFLIQGSLNLLKVKHTHKKIEEKISFMIKEDVFENLRIKEKN